MCDGTWSNRCFINVQRLLADGAIKRDVSLCDASIAGWMILVQLPQESLIRLEFLFMSSEMN